MSPQFPAFDYKNPDVVKPRLLASLPLLHREAFELVLRVAGSKVYLVGGIVRDFLLERPNFDLDFLCLSPASEIVAELLPFFEVKYGPIVKFVEHPQFGTVRLDVGPELHLDFATARQETYAHPAALPTVTFPTTLETDLKRRDFTFNAMTLSGEGNFYDPFDGLADMRSRWIRVLHDLSFIDDPTRMVRAVRFAARLEYRLEPHTEDLLRQSVAGGYFALLSAERRRNELRLILKEASPKTGLALLSSYGLLQTIHPDLKWDDELAKAFVRVKQDSFGWTGALAILLYELGFTTAEKIVKELRFDRADSKLALEVARLWQEALPHLTPDLKNSQLYDLFSTYQPESLKLFAALLQDPSLSATVQHYLDQVANLNPVLNGHDLINLGAPTGVRLKALLQRLRVVVQDGEVSGISQEESFVRKLIEQGD